ncbi:reverse transcriptase domain-containing protein [Tanacetum coccineum]|uniref:Reverse transcriptase domain-containing protein n=1 Tax=Tanacetum coccineum TaxID=301880 RepID=A0ABQ5GT91_9ASTR
MAFPTRIQACSPNKEYDGKGGAIALTRWIEKMENVLDNSGCSENQKVKYAASSFVNKALTWWNTQIQARGREAAIGMTWNDFKALLVEEFCPSNEMERLENEFWNHKMVGYVAGLAPEIRGMLKATQPTTIQNAILRAGILTDEAISCGTLSKSNEKRKAVEEDAKSGGSWRDKKKAKVGAGYVATAPPKNEFVNQYPKCTKCYTYHPEGGECRLCFNCQRPGHFARECRAPFKRAAPVNEVERSQGQAGNSLDLILLGHGSFDVIVGMDWLSQNRVVIVCHEKVVKIPLIGGEILRVQGERALGVGKTLMNVKVDEPKVGDISVVWDFVDVFLEDLSRLPPQR